LRITISIILDADNLEHLQGVQEDELELDIDELSNEVLHKLLQFVRKHAPRPDDVPTHRPVAPAPSAAPTRKKNKPMSKHEQEAQIKDMQKKLQAFQNPGSDEAQEHCTCHHFLDAYERGRVILITQADNQAMKTNESSGDEEDSEESEEE